MEEDIDRLTDPVNIPECTTRLIRIDDDNYQAVINWFKSCLKLSEDLDPSQRDEYELSIIGNVKAVLSDFFQRTELSLNTLIGLEREISSIFEMLGPSSNIKRKEQNDQLSDTCTEEPPSNPPECELEAALKQLFKKLLWVTMASFILLLLLILVLSALCWLRKCIAYEMEETFACCPSKEDIQQKEDADNNPPVAYPIRVWMNPFARFACSAKKSVKNCTAGTKPMKELQKKTKTGNHSKEGH